MTNRVELCERAQELVFALMEPVLAADVATTEREFLAQHLNECPSCRAYQKTMTHLTQSLSDVEEAPIPKGLADRVMVRVEQAAASQSNVVAAPFGRKKPFGGQKMMPVAAAALLLAVAVTWTVGRLMASPPQMVAQQSGHQSELKKAPHQLAQGDTPGSSVLSGQWAGQAARSAVVNDTDLFNAQSDAVEAYRVGGPEENSGENGRFVSDPFSGERRGGQDDASSLMASAFPERGSLTGESQSMLPGDEGDLYDDPTTLLVGF